MIKKNIFLKFLGLATLLISVCSASQEDYWNAKEYHHHSSTQRNMASDLMKHISLKGDETILDVGSGDGKITAKIAELLTTGDVVGLDISPSMIAFATEQYPPEKYPNLSFLFKDGMDLNFDRNFDLVVSFAAINWLNDHRVFLERVEKSLKSNGRVAISSPMGLPDEIKKAVEELMQNEKWKEYFINFLTGWNFPSEETFPKLLEEAGFEVLYFQVINQKDIFPSKEAFKSFISQWFPYLRPLPADLKPIFMDEVINRFIELYPLDEDEYLHFDIKRMEVVAMIK